jgi:TatD DNase family protein
MVLFDTHAHLDDGEFDQVRDEIVARAREAGVESIIAIGTTADSSHRCTELARRYDGVYASVGIQPNYCAEAGPDDWRRIEAMVRLPRVVALGETGLDRYWDYTPFALQEDYFQRHIDLAQQLDLPLVIHMRDCAQDILRMLEHARRRGALRGVMHSFTGDADTAARCVELGLHISFSGIVTYKKSEDLRRVAATIPTERLLIETDAPYLSPHPKRAHRPNEPALIVHTAECLAAVRDTSLAQLAGQTTKNARQLFAVS